MTACDISEEMVERRLRGRRRRSNSGCFMCMDMTQMFAFEMDAVVATMRRRKLFGRGRRGRGVFRLRTEA